MTVNAQPLHSHLVVNQRVLLFPVTWIHEVLGNVLRSDLTILSFTEKQWVSGSASFLCAACLLLGRLQLGLELLHLSLLLLKLLASALQLLLAQVEASSLLSPLLFLLTQYSLQFIDLARQLVAVVKELLCALLLLLHVALELVFLFKLLHEEILELGLIVVISFLFNVLLLIEQRQLCNVHLHLLLLGLEDCLLMLLQLVVRQLRVTEVADTELFLALFGKSSLVVGTRVADGLVAAATVMSRISSELIEGFRAKLACAGLVELVLDSLFQLVWQVCIVGQIAKDTIRFQVI